MIKCRSVALVILCVLALIRFDLNVFAQTKEQAKVSLNKQPDSTILASDLIKRLTQHPELLNADYLDYYFGPRTQSQRQPSAMSRYTQGLATKTMWQPQTGQNIWDKLEVSQQGQSNYMAELIAIVPQMVHMQPEDMQQALGVTGKHSFDEQGQSVDIYVTRPDTQVTTYQLYGLVDIGKIKIKYAGVNPGLPSQADMQEAAAYRRKIAFEHYRLGNYNQAKTLLKEHLKSNPDDAEAHFKLAQSYEATSSLNESINEYRTALAKCGDNDDLRKECLKGLQSLKVGQPAMQEGIVGAGRSGSQAYELRRTGVTESKNINSPPSASVASQGRERININQPANQSPIIKSNTPADPLDVGF